MVVEVGSLDRNALEPFKTWRLGTSACEDDGGINIDPHLFSPQALRRCAKHESNCPSASILRTTLVTANAHGPEHESKIFATTSTETAQTNPITSSPTNPPTVSPFVFPTSQEKANFLFSSQPSSFNRVKRARAESDVDGPYTAGLSCKKRRLRLHLITSRLSQPYSLPATHIINREAGPLGDKRFVKLAAVATSPDVGKQGLLRESSIMLRAAVLNRIRLRVRNEATQRGDIGIAVTAANAAVLHHGQQLATGASTMLDEMEDDGLLAFPTSTHECSYAWADDDDLEDVYSDFGAIFGGSAQTGETDDDGNSYEEYLDELDGISWVGGR
ncbi:hypothetical protein COL5a_009951 [Colletotrichum fioriniae]|uniref:uncharacterized protein n=1 Tax=Colletotrichum fioriniae TaxID=710243 RepID=UPI00230080CB|nr:uncharacterized protein COL516b_010330 [Colletotrichum fioriniae]KAJ0297964.1 hypothetical protein COL516b_010330 [Colletotrichum fioriniae]KAJ0320041.1 hypothetical protein COL5a_009951 [Colletotrichum fioriniae]KAJ3938036.1 hypothetical protein N0V96_012036 [Colletotrichum fioriniae]